VGAFPPREGAAARAAVEAVARLRRAGAYERAAQAAPR